MAEWYAAGDATALARVRAAWPAAPVTNPELLGLVLDVAKEQVVEYAPKESPFDQVWALLFGLGAPEATIATVIDVLDGALPSDTTVPGNTVLAGPRMFVTPPGRFVLAQLQQARNLWDAGRANQDGAIGPDEFRFVPRPLDRTIRAIIRPISGGADVF